MDYIAAIFTALGIVTTGRKWAWGWIISAIGSALWVGISVDRQLWGMCTLNVILIGVAVFNFIKWKNDEL